MEAVSTGITGMLCVYVLLFVLSVSSLRGVRICGGHNMVVSVLAWARYMAVRFLLHKTQTKKKQPAPFRAMTNQGG